MLATCARREGEGEEKRARKYKRILFKFRKRVRVFCADDGARIPSERERESESDRDLPRVEGGRHTAGGGVNECFRVRIIDVRNILEALINVGREATQGRDGARQPRQVAIGFQLENDYSCRVTVACHLGSFVTERKRDREKELGLCLSLSLFWSRCHVQQMPRVEKTHPFTTFSLFFPVFTLKVFSLSEGPEMARFSFQRARARDMRRVGNERNALLSTKAAEEEKRKGEKKKKEGGVRDK